MCQSLIESLNNFNNKEVKRINSARKSKDYTSRTFKKVEKKLVKNNFESFNKQQKDREQAKIMLRCIP